MKQKGFQVETKKRFQIETKKGFQIETKKGFQIETKKGFQIETKKGFQIETKKDAQAMIFDMRKQGRERNAPPPPTQKHTRAYLTSGDSAGGVPADTK